MRVIARILYSSADSNRGMVGIRRSSLLVALICIVAPMILLLSPSSSGPAGADRALQVATTTPTHLTYLPLVLKQPTSPSRPDNWPLLVGYTTFAKITDLPLEELNDYTSFIYTYHGARGGFPTEEDLRALRDSRMQVLLKLDPAVVEDTFDEDALRALKVRLDKYKDVVRALCVVDEPYKPEKNMTEQELTELVQRVKTIFPEYTMYVNFLSPLAVKEYHGGVYPNIPDNIDLISFDSYYKPLESEEAWYKDLISKDIAIIREKAGDRPVFFASLAFRADYEPPPGPDSEPPAYQVEWDYELYLEHSLAGLGWYFYDETDPTGTLYGASYFPELIAKHREIGERILSGAPGPLPTPIPISGEINTLVLRVNLRDVSVECSEAELTASVFGATNSVNAVYSDSSRGALTLNGDVATVAIDYSTADGCLRDDWTTAANGAAAAAGYNLSDYERFIYILPKELLIREICAWGGGVSIDEGLVWSLRCEQPKMVAHELGHTFRLYHASTESDEYGDYSDPMGGGPGATLTQVNAPHLDQMGWLPDTAIQDVTADGVYSIEATEVDPDVAIHPQILRVEKPDSDEYYYVSFRRAIGLDANLEPRYRDDFVSIHRFRGFGSAPGYGPPNTYLLALLGDGNSFADTLNGITITMLSHEGNVATVSIEP